MTLWKQHKAGIVAIAGILVFWVVMLTVVLPYRKTAGQVRSIGASDTRIGHQFNGIQAKGQIDFFLIDTHSTRDSMLVVGTTTLQSLDAYLKSIGPNVVVYDANAFDGVQLKNNITTWRDDYNAPASVLFYPSSMNTDGIEISGALIGQTGQYRLFADQSSGYFILYVLFSVHP